MKTWVINRIKNYNNYNSINLINNLYFHYTEDLDYKIGKSLAGNNFIILGNITHCSQNYEDPYVLLSNCTENEFLTNKKFWGGRWAIFYESKLYTDFTSIYTVFWNIELTLISNTLEVFLENKIDQTDYNITNGHYLNWFVTPKTSFKNVNKLLPGTALNLASKNIELYKLEYAKLYDKSENEISELLSQSLRYEAKSIINKFNKTYVALSAGYDSRLIYAIFSKIDSQTKTFTHIFPSMNMADSKIPNELNVNNLKVYPKSLNKDKIKAYDNRVNKMVFDADRNFYGRGQWGFLKSDEVVVRGGVLELAGISSAHLEDKYKDFGQSISDAKLFLYALKDFREFQHDSFEKYMRYYIERNSKLRWSKQLYIDQRISGWLSYIELGLDLIKGTSIHLGNSEHAVNLMLSLSLKEMEVKAFHIDEIRSSNKALIAIPFNKNTMSNKILRIIANIFKLFFGDKITAKLFY